MSSRRIKVVRLRQHQLLVQMHWLERDMFEITVADEVAIIRTSIIYADSFRSSRTKFTSWIHTNYPEVYHEERTVAVPS
jgi:hypothetical protein